MNSLLRSSLFCCMSMMLALGCSEGGDDPHEFEPALPTWARTYGSYTSSATLNSSTKFSLQTADRNYLLLGHSDWFGGPNGSWVLRLTNTGEVTWSQFLPGYRLRYAASSPSGGYVLTGETTDSKNLVRIELDGDGSAFSGQLYELQAEIWSQFSALSTSDGNMVLLNYPNQIDGVSGDMRVMKLSADGAIVWDMAYTSSSHSKVKFFDVVENSDSSYALVGSVDISQTSSGAIRFFVAQIDPNGGVSWARYFEDERNNAEWATAVHPTPEGGLVAVGSTQGEGGNVILAIKLDKTGELVWRKLIGSSASERASDVVVRPDGIITILGTIYEEEEGELYLVSLDPDGVILWQRAYSLQGNPSSTSITMTDDGGYLISDSSQVGGTKSYLVLHVDGEGLTGDSSCSMIREAHAQAIDQPAVPIEVTLDLNTELRTTFTSISGMSESLDLYGLVDCGEGDPVGAAWGDGAVGDSCDCLPARQCVGPEIGCELGLTCVGNYDYGGNPIADCSHWCFSHADCPEGTTCHHLLINEESMGMWCY